MRSRRSRKLSHTQTSVPCGTLKYAVPVYNLNYITSTSDKIEMTIEDDAFLDVLFLRIRGETIKFSTTRKKLIIQLEKTLLKDIETLEASESQSNTDLLEDKKKFLTLRFP